MTNVRNKINVNGFQFKLKDCIHDYCTVDSGNKILTAKEKIVTGFGDVTQNRRIIGVLCCITA